MSRMTPSPPPVALDELIRRGQRAAVQQAEAIRVFRDASGESQELRRRVHRIHHSGIWPFQVLLDFAVREGPSD